jgi:plasmid stabilization system protein ParE
MRPVEFVPGARVDFDESFDWYAQRSATAAVEFAEAVDAAVISIAGDPERFPSIDGRHRESGLRRFPFRIVFRCEPDRIVVVAIAHASRSPGYWGERR